MKYSEWKKLSKEERKQLKWKDLPTFNKFSAILFISAITILVFALFLPGKKFSEMNRDEKISWVYDNSGTLLYHAREKVIERLKSPSTAHIIEKSILETDGEFVLCYLIFDAKNSFGVLIRNYALIVLRITDKDEFSFNKENIVQFFESPPTDDQRIATKMLNNWN